MDISIPPPVIDAPPSTSTYDVRGVVRVLRTRWKSIVAITVVVVAGAVGLTMLQSPIYAARATLVIKPTNETDVFNPQQDQFGQAQRRVATEADVIKSGSVADLVRQRIGSAPGITVLPSSDADIITIEARDTTRVRARDVANAYAKAYVDVKRKEGIDDLLAASSQVRQRVDDLQKQIDTLDAKAQSTNGVVDQSLSQRRLALLNQQTGFRETLDQLQVRVALASGGASIVGSAGLPNAPVEPRPVRTGMLAFAVGLLLALGAAFGFEHLDDRIRTKEDLERSALGLPVLGTIPSFVSSDVPITLGSPYAPAAEAYRTLRMSVQFLGIDRRLRVLQVTSPNESEGKTTTVANLGAALACAGVSVCVLDCDLRRPRLADAYGVDTAVGVTSILLGTSTIDEVLEISRELGPALKIIPAGPIPPNPSELLSSTAIQRVVEALVDRFDLVIIDSPPTLPVSDALAVSRLADAVLIVTSAGRTTRKRLVRALELMRNVGAPVVGVLLNRSDTGRDESYGYGEGYGEQRSRTVDLVPAVDQPEKARRRKREGKVA